MRYKIFLLTIIVAISPLIVHGKNLRSLRDQLAKQGFTGMLEGKVHFFRLGTLQCNNTKLSVYYYEWEESHPPGKAIHAAYRILFMSPTFDYLGSYHVSDRPIKTGPSTISFNYPEADGNILQCDVDGLPKQVLLDGDRLLEK